MIYAYAYAYTPTSKAHCFSVCILVNESRTSNTYHLDTLESRFLLVFFPYIHFTFLCSQTQFSYKRSDLVVTFN